MKTMSSEACCTCATIICDSPTSFETKNEKQLSTPEDKRLDCCSRGLREPPSYDFATSKTSSKTLSSSDAAAPPPPYTYRSTKVPSAASAAATDEKQQPVEEQPPDTLHFLHPDDTLPSLSLRYNVPLHILKRHNNLTSDHLLSARRTVLIPGSHYPSGVSLSPRPVEGEEEEARKAKIRRWMVGCKCAEYDVAELYLEQAGYDLGSAVERYLADEEWAKAHPLENKKRGKEKVKAGGTWASQAAFLRRQGPS
ncbi:hypothetical protein N0V82_001227 [Gnomoniopsis sp. IMI 355080]|nr:hypothetical protein N0V82_001227 [Gnomoniopsis sp. IMI 355080]